MTTLAHLTDPHLLEDDYRSRPIGARARLAYLSLGRPLDARARRERFAAALRAARAAHVDHTVITGDLTEDGMPRQFEAVADELAQSGLCPDRVTLVPGNHDIYADPEAWHRALRGPLRAFAPTSRAGVPVRVGCATVVPVSTLLPQSVLRSAGALRDSTARRLLWLARGAARAGGQLIVAQHHAPEPHWLPLAQWVDGLAGHAAEAELLRCHPNAYVLFGHSHQRADRCPGADGVPRAFSAAAVVDAPDPLRLYEVASWGLRPVPSEGSLAASALATAVT